MHGLTCWLWALSPRTCAPVLGAMHRHWDGDLGEAATAASCHVCANATPCAIAGLVMTMLLRLRVVLQWRRGPSASARSLSCEQRRLAGFVAAHIVRLLRARIVQPAPGQFRRGVLEKRINDVHGRRNPPRIGAASVRCAESEQRGRRLLRRGRIQGLAARPRIHLQRSRSRRRHCVHTGRRHGSARGCCGAGRERACGRHARRGGTAAREGGAAVLHNPLHASSIPCCVRRVEGTPTCMGAARLACDTVSRGCDRGCTST